MKIALEWQQMLNGDNTLTLSKIAGNMGISRARVTQIMNLLKLPKEIISHVASVSDKKECRLFCERNLRQILTREDTAARLTAFRQLRTLAAS